MRNQHEVRLSLSVSVAVAVCLIGAVATAEPKKRPIQIGAIHNLTGALGSIGAPSIAGARAAAGAEYAYGTLEAKTAWLLFDAATDYAVLLARYFRERYTELGGVIVGDDIYAGGTVDFSDQIARILAQPARPDMLYISAGPDDIGRLVKQLREAGINQPVVGGDGYDTLLLLQVAGAAADNIYFTTHAFLDPVQGTPAVQRFIADYQAEYGAPPKTAFAAVGHDAVMLIAHAIERADSAKQKALPEALEATGDFVGITGSISFGPLTHLPEKEVTVVKVTGTTLTLAAVIRPQKVPLPRGLSR